MTTPLFRMLLISSGCQKPAVKIRLDDATARHPPTFHTLPYSRPRRISKIQPTRG